MSTITNTSKKTLGDYTLAEMGSFSVEQLAGVSFDRQFSPMSNSARVVDFETFDTLTTTFDTETRTFDEMGSTMTNTTVKNLGSYTVEELASFTPEQLANVSFDRQFSPIINTSKPV